METLKITLKAIGASLKEGDIVSAFKLLWLPANARVIQQMNSLFPQK